jgi:N-acetylglutamate synthase-like GNAT family acetyltransferase
MKANSGNSSLRTSLSEKNNMPLKVSMRPATANDASAYLRIGTDAYPPEFHESSAAFLAKLRVFPSGCKIVEVAGESVAFLISHPWTYENPPKLNSEAFTLPSLPNVFFIHSVTVMRAHQKHGIGSALVRTAIALGQSHGFSRLTLISVQDSASFWEKFGFKRVETLSQSIRRALFAYGHSSTYMAGDFGLV